EDDTFYDLCDEYGVAIWQDFMFACGTYPAFDAEFMANVEAEARDNVRRMRHHACMALWCGNNELEQGMPSQEWKESLSWEQYGKLFDVLLPGVVKQLDPQRDYWPCSPHSPLGDREDWMNQGWGDTHLWAVWHGKQPFEWYRTRQDRFCSEFGFQSFPEPAVISDFAPPEDWNITSYVMEYHQRSDIGNSTIIHYMLDWFRLPTSFEATVWLSQILQGMAMKYAVEHWRRHMPRTMGTLYWQLNDCWPAPSWASVDYKGNWKALHYMAKRFYAPLLVSGVEDPATGSVAVYVNSDRQKALSGIVRWTLTTAGGATIETGEQTITTPVNGSAKVATLDCNAALGKYGARDLLVWLSLTVEGEAPSENLVLFARPKHLQLVNPELKVEISGAGEGQYAVTVTAQNPALFVWLELPGARFSDNFFDLRPSQSKQVTITSDKDLAAIQRDLKAQSVVDTYQ
ncbi:MAG: hypothetical protein K8L99_14790, partial [Anaerolineae bacterium]|nr:hypothetical protein [Anaerolineae bacterium]